jgi:hypothetical protein
MAGAISTGALGYKQEKSLQGALNEENAVVAGPNAEEAKNTQNKEIKFIGENYIRTECIKGKYQRT